LPPNIPAMARMEQVQKVTVTCPLAHENPETKNKWCKNGITVYADRQGGLSDERRTHLAGRIAQHLWDVHNTRPYGVAQRMGLDAVSNLEIWTDFEETTWDATPRHDPRPVSLTSAAAVPIGASSSSGSGGTAGSRTAARDLSPAALAMIENMSVRSLWALIEAAQREISQRTSQ